VRPPLVLVRHGSTPWTDPERLYQGRVDVPLSEAGRAQAARLGELLAAGGLAQVWHSPLARTRETAEVIAAACGAPCRPDPRLVELSFGSWEGRSHAEVRREEPEAHARHDADVLGGTPPGGEPVASLLERLSGFLEQRWVEGAGRTAVVTHEGVIRAAAVLCDLIPLRRFHDFRPPPGSALEIVPDPQGVRLRMHNAPESVLDVLVPGPAQVAPSAVGAPLRSLTPRRSGP
jgi:broad specificity phosphatase PhoE